MSKDSIEKQTRLEIPQHNLCLRSVPHCDEIPVPVFAELPEIGDEEFSSSTDDGQEADVEYKPLDLFF